jgi:Flp pilus assembly pilin Flp
MVTETATPRTEEFRITGEELLAKLRQLVHEGNIRRIMIRNEAGTTLVEIPLTVGLVGVALVPVWAAVGAIAALASDYSIVVERRD